MESLRKRVADIKRRLQPDKFHVVTVRGGEGETKEQAIKKYAKENGINPDDILNPILVNIPSDEQIRERVRRDSAIRILNKD